jgi:hypothetical protein
VAHSQENPSVVSSTPDTNFIHIALEHWAPGKRFCDLDTETQSRIVLHAQQLKVQAREAGAL